ncbi:MAG: hypothetical protein IJ035_09785, partial [Oscillospiraceae bacterium]|nr:hypothetical protein [Oscillospiraceae bacterium]
MKRKLQKRKFLQERNFLTATKLLLSYSDKGKVRPKRATGTFWNNKFDLIATRGSGLVRFPSKCCR